LTEEQNKKYMNILYAIDRLTEIVKNIQYLSKKTIIEKKNFDIHNVATDAFNMIKDSIDKRVRLEINFNA
jgi:nitrogen-specific signal transduction histidine kinase